MHRFYVGETALGDLQAGDELALGQELQHRLTNVLRMRGGEHVSFFGSGREIEAELVREGRRLRALLLRESPPEPSRPSLTVFQAVIRPNRFEWLLEKATELGVERVVPIITEHTSHQPADVSGTRFERWARIVVEASEQCGRHKVPGLSQPASFAEAIQSSAGLRVFAWEELRAEPCPVNEVVPVAPHYALFIGPEGGWAEHEVQQARAAGSILLRLGPTTLRAETAAIAAISLVMLAAR